MQHRPGTRLGLASARLASFAPLIVGAAALGFAATGFAQEAKTSKAAASTPATITEDQAKEIALKSVPGKVTGVAIEKKRGKNVYVVEIMTEKDGEKDALVDMVTGKFLGTE
jgi:uncharacterized membrane protein YkoI